MKTHFLPHPSRLTQLKLWGLLLLWAGHPLPEAQIVVTEVMYHPQEQAGEEDTEKLEFIELFNAGQKALSRESAFWPALKSSMNSSFSVSSSPACS